MSNHFYTDRFGTRHTVWFVDGRCDDAVFILRSEKGECDCQCLIRGPRGSFIESRVSYRVGYDRLHPSPSLGELCSV